MPERLTVDLLDPAREVAREVARSFAPTLRGHRYCDVRLEVAQSRQAVVENGQPKASQDDATLSYCVRVLAEAEGQVAPGYFGGLLGLADLDCLAERLRSAVEHAHRRAQASASRKASVRGRFGPLGSALASLPLAPVPVREEQVPARFRVDPRTVSLEEVLALVLEVGREVAGLDGRIAFSLVAGGTGLVREVFASSEGALIDQSYALTEGMVFVVAVGQHGPLELYDFTGHQRGWEVLTEGYRSGPIQLPSLRDFALHLARLTLETADAPPLRPPEGEVVVVTDPHFNALVCHEVVGHPSELDRALKMETAYAGRSWLLRDLAEHQMGRQVASPVLSAFSDPTMEGFGHYLYDHEGTPGRRVYHIRNGLYEEFLNSRETAPLIGAEPNGHYRASEGFMVPLIRMSNTAFAPGDRDPQDILREVDRGYYVVGHRIPSVAESRENFRISAMQVYEIRNGELGQLYRDGAVMADTRDYFLAVDAVGNDFRLFPIPNCGKGQPMQTKRMGNGGPTMRSRARLTGGGA